MNVQRYEIPVLPRGFRAIVCCEHLLWFLSVMLIIVTFPISLFYCIKVVQDYERIVVLRLGRLVYGGVKGPGVVLIIPCIDSFRRVDLRTKSYNVPPQEILTRDSLSVSIDAVVFYRVCNATKTVKNVVNMTTAVNTLAICILRTVLGTKTLHELLVNRTSLNHEMQNMLDSVTEPWGVQVERIEIKDLCLPQQMQRTMAAEADASRKAQANVIAADGERIASRALTEAAKVIDQSAAALKLRYLQALGTIAGGKSSTILFPVPLPFGTVSKY